MIFRNINTKDLSDETIIRINKGLKYLKDIKISEFKVGKFEIEAENIFALHQEYKTIPRNKCKLEAHKRYIDIQYILDGEELIGYANIDKLEIDSEYNTENDIVFFKQASMSEVILKSGEYAIFEPEDAHSPQGIVEFETNVKKIVIKVLK